MTKKKIILHVDDEPDILAATSQVLDNEGYEVVTANSALAGLRLFGKYEDQIVGIIVDLRMSPVDGIQFAKEIRSVSTVPILAFSAYLDTENQQKCIQAGISGHIKKPATIEVIMEAVRRCFEGTRAYPRVRL